MKRLLFLLFCPALALAQIQPFQTDRNVGSYFVTNNGTVIKSKAFTGTTNDTTEILSLTHHKTVYLNVEALDSATVLIDYALSDDASNFSTFATKDSLSHGAAGNGFKSVDFTSTTLGARYVKFRLRFSANAFAVGTTSATYHASYVLKKE